MAASSLALNPLIHMSSVAVVMVSEFATGGFALRDGVTLAAGFIIATAQLHELLFNIVVSQGAPPPPPPPPPPPSRTTTTTTPTRNNSQRFATVTYHRHRLLTAI